MKKTYALAELTAQEMRAAVALDPVILIPMGSFEDQGPHSPMGDYLAAEKIAHCIAEHATGQGISTYVAPVIPFGVTDFFGYLPGAVALSSQTMRSVLDDVFSALLRHKLRKLVIVNGHGGNCPVIHEVTQNLYVEKEVIIPSFYLWAVANHILPGIVGDEKAMATRGHGGNPLTSIMLHHFPALVRKDLMVQPTHDHRAWGLDVHGIDSLQIGKGYFNVPFEWDSLVPNAMWKGDPYQCDAETGKALTDELIIIGTDIVRHVNRANS